MEKSYVITESDLKKLEEARKLLHQLVDHKKQLGILNVTQITWELTHKKYPLATDYAVIENE